MMDRIHRTIQTTTKFQLVTDPHHTTSMPVELSYRTAEPLTIFMNLGHEPDSAVHWLVCRQLMAEGLSSQVGEGDVRIAPRGDTILEIELDTPDGHARLHAPASVIAEFLAETYDIVPVHEADLWLDLDEQLEQLFRSDSIRDSE